MDDHDGCHSRLALAVVVAYMLMTGLPASAQRAAIMTSVGLVVWALPSFKMPGSLYIGLGLSATLFLLRDPEELFRPGFQLSFLAVLTLALGTPVVDGLFMRLRARRPGKPGSSSIDPRSGRASASGALGRLSAGSRTARAVTALRIFLAAQIAIQFGLNIPASAVYFGHYSVAGLLVNMAAIPLASILTPGALVVGLLDMIPVAGPWLALPVAWIMERLFDVFLWISATCAGWLPYPEVASWPWWVVVGYYAVLISGMVVSPKVMTRHKASAL